MNLRDRIAKEFTFYSISFVFMQIVNIALAVFIRNILGPEQMGVWVALQIVLTYTKYSNLGLAGAASREIPYEKGRGHIQQVDEIRNSSYTFTLLVSAVLSAGMIVGAFFVQKSLGTIYGVSLMTLAFLSFFQRSSTFCIAMVRAERRFDFINRFNVYSSIANAVLIVLLVQFFKLYGYYAAMVLSFAFNFFYLVGFSGISFRWQWNWPLLMSLFKMGIVLVFVNLVDTFFVSVDKLSITALINVKALGIYSIVMLASNTILMFPNNLSVIVFPYLNEAYGASKEPEDVKKFVLLPNQFIATYLPLLIGLLWILSPVLVRSFMPKYMEGVMPLKVGLWASLFVILSANIGNTLITFKKYGWMIPVQLVIAAGMFAANVVLTRHGFGLTAIACTDLAGYALLWGVYSALSLKTFSIHGLYLSHVMRLLLCAGYMFLIVFALDYCLPQQTPQALAIKLAVWMVSSVPVLILAEKTFETRRILRKILSGGRRAAEISPALGETNP